MAKNRRAANNTNEKQGKVSMRGPGMRLLMLLAALTTLCALTLAVIVYRYEAGVAASRQELAELPSLPEASAIVWSDVSSHNKRMLEINPDYVATIQVEGIDISYPVVRGTDNVKYLGTSFGGTETPLGGLFMDYRCVDEAMRHIIIYGHHALDTEGNRYFFGALDVFLDEQYRLEHPTLVLIGNERLSEYEIFSARVSDIADPAYWLDFSGEDSFDRFLEQNGAPADAAQILTLSTCYDDGSDDRRIIVQAVRKSSTPLDEMQMMVGAYDYL